VLVAAAAVVVEVAAVGAGGCETTGVAGATLSNPAEDNAIVFNR